MPPLCTRLGPLTNVDGSVTNALGVRLQLQDKQATLAEDVLKGSCPVTPSSPTLNRLLQARHAHVHKEPPKESRLKKQTAAAGGQSTSSTAQTQK
jgi:hypothetical protein